MRKRRLLAGLLSAVLMASGCAGEPSAQAEVPDAPGTEIVYSNLADETTRKELADVMTAAGIAQGRQDVFFAHVEQINAVLKPEEKTQGWEGGDPILLKYDPYEVQDRWMAEYPDFMGYNCRITAFSLFGDFVTVPAEGEVRDEPLMFDLSALEADDSAFPGQIETFRRLYSGISTDTGRDAREQLRVLQQDWKTRGIVFRDVPEVRLISVVLHDMIDESNPSLFIGHTGLLFPTDKALYFVEKLSFQEPYQCIRFGSRSELSDYLMMKYDLDEEQPTAPPFILENDSLIEGWKTLRTDS